MRLVDVDVFADVPSYPSAAEAIAAESNSVRAKRSAEDSLLLSGSTIQRYWIDRSAFCIQLSNGRYLRLVASRAKVEWVVDSDCGPQLPDSSDAIELRWPSGRITKWDPGRFLASRVPFAVTEMFAGSCYINLYFAGGGVLQFLPVWNSSDSVPILYVYELEPIP